jgi:nucleoside-diphosphate-sugar epimerase
MNVAITGGAGFLGQRLARELLRDGMLRGAGGSPQPIERLTLVDLLAPADTPGDPRLTVVTGDIGDPALLERALGTDTDAVFHLAAVVSGMAEAEFDLGMRVNLDATRALLDVCRAGGRRPRVVFASSVAVYGGPLPEVVTDATALNPQSSYGMQKAIGELLINDYSRKGFVDGRVLRLPTVSVRPGRPNAAASSFASGIIREPLNGEPAVCPVAPDTRIWVASPSTVIRCLVAGHDLPAEAFGTSRIVNLPGLSVTPKEMTAALERVAGPEVVRRIEWTRDARIERIVASWPGAWDNTRARALGFPADPDFESVIRGYVEERLRGSRGER